MATLTYQGHQHYQGCTRQEFPHQVLHKHRTCSSVNLFWYACLYLTVSIRYEMVRPITCYTKDRHTKTPLLHINTDKIGTFSHLRRHCEHLKCLCSILHPVALERIGIKYKGVNVSRSRKEATDTLVEVQLGKSLSARGSPVKMSEWHILAAC